MEFINKIELQGIVGRVNTQLDGGLYTTRFSLVTENTYTENGQSVIETTWTGCATIPSEHPVFADIYKGEKVNVIGRLHNRRYTDEEGKERTTTEIVCDSVTLLD